MVVNAVAGFVTGFRIGPRRLRPLMKFDASAQYLYVGNRSAKTIAALAIDPNTGSMSLVPGSPFVSRRRHDRIVVTRIP